LRGECVIAELHWIISQNAGIDSGDFSAKTPDFDASRRNR